jgi:hypothetical protein
LPGELPHDPGSLLEEVVGLGDGRVERGLDVRLAEQRFLHRLTDRRVDVVPGPTYGNGRDVFSDSRKTPNGFSPPKYGSALVRSGAWSAAVVAGAAPA